MTGSYPIILGVKDSAGHIIAVSPTIIITRSVEDKKSEYIDPK
jgi:hypothetical protein